MCQESSSALQSLSQAGMLSTESAYPIRCANTASDRHSTDKRKKRDRLSLKAALNVRSVHQTEKNFKVANIRRMAERLYCASKS